MKNTLWSRGKDRGTMNIGIVWKIHVLMSDYHSKTFQKLQILIWAWYVLVFFWMIWICLFVFVFVGNDLDFLEWFIYFGICLEWFGRILFFLEWFGMIWSYWASVSLELSGMLWLFWNVLESYWMFWKIVEYCGRCFGSFLDMQEYQDVKVISLKTKPVE
jgi:hypothetical protein